MPRLTTDPLPTGWKYQDDNRLRCHINSRFGADSLPAGAWLGPVSAVVTDANGHVVVLQRGGALEPIVVLDPTGGFVRSWNAGIGLPHGLRIDPTGNLWVTDIGTHQVVKASVEGDVLLTLGTPGKRGTDSRTFDEPTDVAFGADGRVYVADGYGNSRVVVFDQEGRFVTSWGRRGTGPGEFHTPHSISVAPDGLVWVSDRGNHRIQVFDPDGSFISEWVHLGATQCVEFGPRGELWTANHRSVSEIIAYDSLAGRLMRLNPVSAVVMRSLEMPCHWVHQSATGELFVASLSGNVIHVRPD